MCWLDLVPECESAPYTFVLETGWRGCSSQEHTLLLALTRWKARAKPNCGNRFKTLIVSCPLIDQSRSSLASIGRESTLSTGAERVAWILMISSGTNDITSHYILHHHELMGKKTPWIPWHSRLPLVEHFAVYLIIMVVLRKSICEVWVACWMSCFVLFCFFHDISSLLKKEGLEDNLVILNWIFCRNLLIMNKVSLLLHGRHHWQYLWQMIQF